MFARLNLIGYQKGIFFFTSSLFILMFCLLLLLLFFSTAMDSHLLSDSCLHTLHAITDLVGSLLVFLFSFPFLHHPCRRCRWLFFLLLLSISFIHYSKFGDACSHLSLFNFVYCISLFEAFLEIVVLLPWMATKR